MHKIQKFAFAAMLMAVVPVSMPTNTAPKMYQDILNRIRSKFPSSWTAPKTPPAPSPFPVPEPAPAPAPEPEPHPEPSPEPNPEPASTQGSEKMWGAFVAGGNASSLESMVGKKMDIQAVFYGWGDSFPSNSDKSRTLLIFWEQTGTTLDQIISGQSDSYIKQFASAAKSYGGPVILAPLHEMNGNWSSWCGTVAGNTPQKVVSAWKHIHDVFGQSPNVKWDWVVNSNSVPNTSANAIANYYPGSSYVDYVGIDGFNFGNPWVTYSQIFSSPVQQLKSYNKPILISSMASAAGAQKAAWITDALQKIKSDPAIKGFVWFNENKEQNWLINSDPQSLQAFKNGI